MVLESDAESVLNDLSIESLEFVDKENLKPVDNQIADSSSSTTLSNNDEENHPGLANNHRPLILMPNRNHYNNNNNNHSPTSAILTPRHDASSPGSDMQGSPTARLSTTIQELEHIASLMKCLQLKHEQKLTEMQSDCSMAIGKSRLLLTKSPKRQQR